MVPYIDYFVSATHELLLDIIGGDVEKGQATTFETSSAFSGISIIVGLAGDLKGRMLLGMNKNTALSISGTMNGTQFDDFSDLVLSTINEIGNMAGGMAITKLSDLGLEVHISPPSLVTGDNMEITNPSMDTHIIPLITSYGTISVNLSLKENAL